MPAAISKPVIEAAGTALESVGLWTLKLRGALRSVLSRHDRAMTFAPGLLLLGIAHAATVGAPQVALVTFGPGGIYWERFGHDALIVTAPASEPIVYNYGVFDFQQKNFLLNFARGHSQYRLMAEPLRADLARYVAAGREVTVQLLNLTPAQSRYLAAFLAWNARPENARYRYDYYIDNCATKVRDALNDALGGALERQLAVRPTHRTYRFDTIRLISPDFWMALGMDVGLGPRADRPLSLWQESFVPMVLSSALRHVVVRDADGAPRPLVSDDQVVYRGDLPPAPAAPPDLRLPFLLVGLALAVLLLWLARGKGQLHRTSFAVLAVAWWLICAVTGLVLAALWGFTDQWAAWGNENLLVLDPLCLALPWVWWRAPRVARYLTAFIAVVALISLIVRWLPALYQSNLAFIALAAPVHVLLAALAWHRGSHTLSNEQRTKPSRVLGARHFDELQSRRLPNRGAFHG